MQTPNRWRHIKGRRTRYGHGKRYAIQHVPRALNAENLCVLKCFYDIQGKTTIDREGTNTTVQMMYRPLLATPDTTNNGIARTFTWNDGILTGNYSHYTQYPNESRATNGSGRPDLSNIMLRGRELYGGSLIGTDWDPDTSRFTTNIGAGVDRVYKAGTVLSVNGTRRLHLHSYNINLQEQTWVNAQIIPAQTCSDDRLWRHFILHRDTSFLGVEGTDTDANLGENALTSYELRQSLAKAARVKVRNIIIRLPAEPTELGNTGIATADRRYVGAYNAQLNTAARNTWQEVLWEIIKQDFFLIGDNTYGPPSGYNKDLRARINPKYTVLKDYCTYMGCPTTMGKKPTSTTHHFNHNFATKYPTLHNQGKAIFQFKSSVDVGTSDTVDMTVSTSTAIPMQMQTTSVDDVSLRATNKRPRVGTEGGNTVDKGYTVTAPTTTTGEDATLTGVLEAPADAVTPDIQCLLPASNRIVWIRIPRLAGDVELQDLMHGSKVQPFGMLPTGTTSTGTGSNLHLLCIAQLCSVLEGSSTYKFINPAVFGHGQVYGPDDSATGRYGPDEDLMEL
jgi:hypothetical protein